MIILSVKSYSPATDKKLASEFVDVCRRHAEVSRTQTGCKLFEVRDSVVGSEVEVIYYEAWLSKKDLDAHQAASASSECYARLNELRTRKEITTLLDNDPSQTTPEEQEISDYINSLRV